LGRQTGGGQPAAVCLFLYFRVELLWAAVPGVFGRRGTSGLPVCVSGVRCGGEHLGCRAGVAAGGSMQRTDGGSESCCDPGFITPGAS